MIQIDDLEFDAERPEEGFRNIIEMLQENPFSSSLELYLECGDADSCNSIYYWFHQIQEGRKVSPVLLDENLVLDGYHRIAAIIASKRDFLHDEEYNDVSKLDKKQIRKILSGSIYEGVY